jgi:hypothetical protein
MVRRDAKERPNSAGGGMTLACCAAATGESPVPAGVGAPGSRPQVVEGDLRARAGCQQPVRRREPRSGEQARGPQHEVKPAAATDLRPAGRVAHVTAKATSLAGQLQRRIRAAAKRAPGGRVPVTDSPRGRDDLRVTCAAVHPAQPLLAGAGPHNAASRRPRVSRVREIRMHGLSGGVGSERGLRAA